MPSERELRFAGPRLGRLLGIELFLHWFLIVLLAVHLVSLLLKKNVAQYGNPLVVWVAFCGSFLLSLFLHELGHRVIARREGGSLDRFVLWPLGGTAPADLPPDPRIQLRVAIAGPATSLALALIAGVIAVSLGWRLLPFGDPSAGPLRDLPRLFVQHVFSVNIALLIVNVLPCWPHDGGMILHSLLWNRLGVRQGSLLVALSVSRFFAIGGIAFFVLTLLLGLAHQDFPFERPLVDLCGVLFLFMGFTHFLFARVRRLEIEHGEDESGIFGYDFSSGYTSLEASAQAEEVPSRRARRRAEKRRKARDNREREDQDLRRRLDELLAKIHREGMDSLSREERKFLERASRHVRKSTTNGD